MLVDFGSRVFLSQAGIPYTGEIDLPEAEAAQYTARLAELDGSTNPAPENPLTMSSQTVYLAQQVEAMTVELNVLRENAEHEVSVKAEAEDVIKRLTEENGTLKSTVSTLQSQLIVATREKTELAKKVETSEKAADKAAIEG